MKTDMKIVRRILLLLLLAVPLTMAGSYLFKVLDAKDGLTSSQINCMLKDSRGFMWIGTPSGLYRYDGYVFRHFQSDSQDASSLPDSYISSLQEESNGMLWVKTATGYCIYNPRTESFERDMDLTYKQMSVNSRPSLVYVDSQHNIWSYIARKKIVRFNTEQQISGDFTMSDGLIDDKNSLPSGNICSLGECKNGIIAVYSDGRLVCLDPIHPQVILWVNDEISRLGLRNSSSLKVFADQKDNLWLYGQGTLFLYDKNTRTWNTSFGNQLGLSSVSADNSVNSMDGDRKGNIWVATSRHGLLRINVNTHAVEHVELTTMANLQMRLTAAGSAKSIQSVYVDDSDLLWVGTTKSGVAYWGESVYRFESNPKGDITAMAQDSTKRVLYGTSDNGIVGYDGPLASRSVTAMAWTMDSSLWVGSPQNGLTRIRRGTTTFYSTSSDDNKIIDNHINAMCTDANGILWIATEGGLQNYNPRLNTFASYTKKRNQLPSDNITSLNVGAKNELFIGTSEGLSILNLSNNRQEHLIGNKSNTAKFTNAYITQVFEDSRKLLWIGTREGLNVLNRENDELRHITERQDALCNNNICGIAEDAHHNIWVTTSNGVCRIVIDFHKGALNYGLYNYNQSDGLLGNEFNTGSILTRSDGKIEMGGIFGVSQMRDRSDDEKHSLPKVILTQLLINEEEIETGMFYHQRVILPMALNDIPELHLKYNENTFTVKFAAGNYNQSERLQFNYMLKGYDDTYKAGNALTHSVTFTDLPSGSYELLVKASSAESNAQSAQETRLRIVVDKPWWMEWWMIAAYVLVVVIALYLWKKGIDQIRRLWAKKNAVIKELVRQREDIKQASDDLRQPMARMTSIIMKLAERENTLEEREQLNNLHSQMLQIITQVSDMQAALEHPEEKARQNVQRHFELNSKGEMSLPDIVGDELTYEIRHRQDESPLSGFKLFFIDNNKEFVDFIDSRLRYVYELHTFTDIRGVLAEIETTVPDLVVCKHDMEGMSGSELCNKVKMDHRLYKIKFVLMTETKLSSKEMKEAGITMGADDYLSKPFNLQEAVTRFNKLLGIESFQMSSNLIEGAETRMLEGHNSSMTTSTVTMDTGGVTPDTVENDREMQMVTVTMLKDQDSMYTEGNEGLKDNRSMHDIMDEQLLNSIEQYVRQNMSRGSIDLEEMATAMGMAMRPFFQKVRDITGKTPAEVVRDLRLKHACILLQCTNINMNELANNIGFATGDHFISMFKERFGILPTEYRLKHRQ